MQQATQLQEVEEFQFVWLDCTNRFDLEATQLKLLNIIRKADNNKTLILVVDHFCFQESITSLLEMYTEQNLLIKEGVPVESFKKIKVILVMGEHQFQKCKEYGVFSNKFSGIYIKSPLEENVDYVMEQVIEWHLTTKAFSSEYKTLIGPLARASLRLMKVCNKPPSRYLSLAIRLCKGLMYSFPDNTPDLDSMIRLWTHEIMRILLDGEVNAGVHTSFFKDFDQVIREELKTSVEKLFPSKTSVADEEDEEDGESVSDSRSKQDGISSSVQYDFSLDSLTYSEMAGLEIMDGIAYGMLHSRNEFNRALENLHFEYSRNNEGNRMNLVITSYISQHCQRVMRVSRQHNEHIALMGRPGSGRYQCVRLATFGLVGQILHIFFDTESAGAFEQSWKKVMRRLVLLLANANHVVNIVLHLDYILKDVPEEWMLMLKQWIQSPLIEEVLSDEFVLKCGENVVESEKAMATLLQSSNIRLPGQRSVRFLPYESMKNVELLKNILSARVTDLATFVFLIPPPSEFVFKHQFDWCTTNYFSELTTEQIAQMKEKIVGECVYEYRSKLLDTLNQVYSATCITTSTSSSSLSDKKPKTIVAAVGMLNEVRLNTKFMHDFFQGVVAIYNTKHSRLEKKITVLKNAINSSTKIRDLNFTEHNNYTTDELTAKLDDDDLNILMLKRNLHEASITKNLIISKIDQHQKEMVIIVEKLKKHKSKVQFVMQEPEEELHKITNKLSHYHAADFRKLALMKIPPLGVRFAVESVRLLIDEDFKLKANAQDNWKACQGRLTSHGMYNDLLTFNPLSVNNAKLKALQRYTGNREFKPGKLKPDSELAADLCQWTFAVVNVANINKVLKNHRKGLNESTTQLTHNQVALQGFGEELERCKKRSEALELEIKDIEEEVIKIRRSMEYKQRSNKVLSALNQHHNRWKGIITTAKTSFDNLLGNCILKAGFRVLLASQTSDFKLVSLAKWKSLLLKNGVNYDEKISYVHLLINSLLNETGWSTPWPIVLEPRKSAETLAYLEKLFASHNLFVVDMTELSSSNGSRWLANELVDKVHRAAHSDSTLILHNLNSSPPSCWYELLNRELDKEKQNIIFNDTPLRIRPKFRLIFLASFDQITSGNLDLQFLRMLQAVVVEGKVDMRENLTARAVMDELEISLEEDTLLKMLTEYTAVDILKSNDLSEQVVRFCNSLSIQKEAEGSSKGENISATNSHSNRLIWFS